MSLFVITWQNVELSLQAILLTELIDLVPLPLVCVCVHVYMTLCVYVWGVVMGMGVTVRLMGSAKVYYINYDHEAENMWERLGRRYNILL